MSYQEKDIMHESANHWILRVRTGFEIYRTGITHSTRCASIGFRGERGMYRAMAELERREVLITSLGILSA